MLFYKILTFVLTLSFFFSFTTNVSAATFEEEVESLINVERQKRGLSELNSSDKLFQASLKHNNIMFDCSKSYGTSSCFKHQVTLLGEEGLLARIQKTGYNPQAVAENIAWGYQTPSSVVSGWMGSSGHKANILGNYKDIGCDYLDGLNGSYKGKYWTCDFGKSFTSSSSFLTPIPTPIIKPTHSQSSGQAPTQTPSPTPTISQAMTPTPTSSILRPGSQEWWCKYAPGSYFCPNP